MTAEESKKGAKMKGKGPGKITFRCQCCQELQPLEDMKIVTRFFPLLVVCRDCEKEIR